MKFKVGDKVQGRWNINALGTVIEITTHYAYSIRVRWHATGLVGDNRPSWLKMRNGLQHIKRRHNL